MGLSVIHHFVSPTANPIPILIVFVYGEHFFEIFHAVTGQRGGNVPRETHTRFQSETQFGTQTVTVGHILGKRFADLVESSRENQLVLVVHIIKVGACVQPIVAELISGLVVEQALADGLHGQIRDEVVARGLLVGHAP